MDVLTGADPPTGVVLPCHVGAALAASRVGCATHTVTSTNVLFYDDLIMTFLQFVIEHYF